MHVIKLETPKLRFIYNNYLLTRPGFSGKVTITFTIGTNGLILTSRIDKSTTNFDAFDVVILKEVKTFVFKPSRSGNTTVTVPWNFSK